MHSKIAALSVHLFTAIGILLAFWALILIVDGNVQSSLIVLALAVLVDSVDGTLARRANVSTNTPNIDGERLDNIVDYLTWVFLPAVWAYYFLGVPFSVGTVVLISSLFGFSHKQAKTENHFFRGFPSYWNFVVLYLYVLSADPLVSSIVLLILSALVLIPIRFVYPSRTEQWKKITLILSFPYALMLGTMLIYLKETPLTVTVLSFYYPIYYVGVSVFLSRSNK
ncbi:CDP-alcohol phosphatidyltransferase family protein [Gracilimonas sp. Q87]|uniref:CDP-alcohol phosphatidyltransferase family protein n=1 Tax=Gracilimonas sp. Q87 TaxID=3384766 RepID=UPI0039844428